MLRRSAKRCVSKHGAGPRDRAAACGRPLRFRLAFAARPFDPVNPSRPTAPRPDVRFRMFRNPTLANKKSLSVPVRTERPGGKRP
mgnify:CR=1 FL=1